MLKEGYAYTLDVRMREHPETGLTVPAIMGDGGSALLDVATVAWAPSEAKKAADPQPLSMNARQAQRAMIGRARAKAEQVLKRVYGDGYVVQQGKLLKGSGETDDAIIRQLVDEANEHLPEHEQINPEAMGLLEVAHAGTGVREVDADELDDVEDRVCKTGRDGSEGGTPRRAPCGRLFESAAKAKSHWRSAHKDRNAGKRRKHIWTNFEEQVL